MSYIRPLERKLGLYIYPDIRGFVNFWGIPNHLDEQLPDEMLDILLSRMDTEDIESRKKHGEFLLDVLEQKDDKTWEKYKGLYDWEKDYADKENTNETN